MICSAHKFFLGLTSFEALLDRVSEAKKSTQRKKLVPRVPATH